MTLYPVSKCTPQRAVDMVEMYGPERLLVNSAGDWGPSKPTAVPDFIMAMRLPRPSGILIRRIVYDNPLEFFSQSRGFQGARHGGRDRADINRDRSTKEKGRIKSREKSGTFKILRF